MSKIVITKGKKQEAYFYNGTTEAWNICNPVHYAAATENPDNVC